MRSGGARATRVASGKDETTDHMGQRVWGFRLGSAKTHSSKPRVSMPTLVVELLRAHRKQ
jgi:hypothetical protein